MQMKTQYIKMCGKLLKKKCGGRGQSEIIALSASKTWSSLICILLSVVCYLLSTEACKYEMENHGNEPRAFRLCPARHVNHSFF